MKICGWCGQEFTNDHDCGEGTQARGLFSKIAGQLRFVADILDCKACVFGEEPLSGALSRLQKSEQDLAAILAKRDSNLAQDEIHYECGS